MNESLYNAYESFEDEEITQVREKPAEVISLRDKIYLVVTNDPEQSIQEYDIDAHGRLIEEISGKTSDWRFESATRIGNWERPFDDISEPLEDIALEDEKADKYFTYDFGKAVVRYIEILEEDRHPRQAAEEIKFDESIPVDTSDIDQLARDLGLADEESSFFI